MLFESLHNLLHSKRKLTQGLKEENLRNSHLESKKVNGLMTERIKGLFELYSHEFKERPAEFCLCFSVTTARVLNTSHLLSRFIIFSK